MCLAIPGKIIKIENQIDDIFRIAKVSFNGIVKEVNLAMVPEAKINDYVLVHVGSAISIVDEEEAKTTMDILMQMEDLDELENGTE
ncbi:MAG: HypC/HybG/HupF family hydrogenase formation chaperone [Bacteroidota bacterium]